MAKATVKTTPRDKTKKAASAKKASKTKTPVKKTAGKKASAKKAKTSTKKKSATKKTKTSKKKSAVAPKKLSGKKLRKAASKKVDPKLFAALSTGERIDAERILLSDPQLQSMARVGRYRIVCAEPWVAKPPHTAQGKRLARVVCYNYADDCAVTATIDLEETEVLGLQKTKSQPMLALAEEYRAIETAFSDERVAEELALGDSALATMHYWSARDSDLSSQRRSAAVLIGPEGGSPRFIAVVDLVADEVTNITKSEQW